MFCLFMDVFNILQYKGKMNVFVSLIIQQYFSKPGNH